MKADRIVLKVGTEVIITAWPRPVQATIIGLVFYWAPGKGEHQNDLALELEDSHGKRWSNVYYRVTHIVQRGASGGRTLIAVED